MQPYFRWRPFAPAQWTSQSLSPCQPRPRVDFRLKLNNYDPLIQEIDKLRRLSSNRARNRDPHEMFRIGAEGGGGWGGRRGDRMLGKTRKTHHSFVFRF